MQEFVEAHLVAYQEYRDAWAARGMAEITARGNARARIAELDSRLTPMATGLSERARGVLANRGAAEPLLQAKKLSCDAVEKYEREFYGPAVQAQEKRQQAAAVRVARPRSQEDLQKDAAEFAEGYLEYGGFHAAQVMAEIKGGRRAQTDRSAERKRQVAERAPRLAALGT